MNVTRHDADLALAWLDDARAVRTNESGLVLRHQNRLDLDHVEGRNSLGDADDKIDLSLNSFKNRVGGERRRHINNARLSSGFLLALSH